MGSTFLTAPCSLYKDSLEEFLPSKAFLLFLSPLNSGLNVYLPLTGAGKDVMTCANLCPGFISLSYLPSLLICPSFYFIFSDCMYFVSFLRIKVYINESINQTIQIIGNCRELSHFNNRVSSDTISF